MVKVRSEKGHVSRKERRKEERKCKKLKKCDYFAARKEFRNKQDKGSSKVVSEEKIHNVKKVVQQLPNKTSKLAGKHNEILKQHLPNKKSKPAGRHNETLAEKMKIQRKRRLIEDNEKEDVVIKQLEKKLKLNKRSNKSTPKSFVESGLDYILDVCDNTKINEAVSAEKTLYDSDSDFSDDLAAVAGNKDDTVENDENEINESGSDSEDVMSDEFDNEKDKSKREVSPEGKNSEDDESIDNEMSEDSYEDEDNVEEDEKDEKNNDTWEDIYGRIRDKKGNVVNENTKYIPPHLRGLPEDNKKKEELDRIKRELKGLLNRLTSNNMQGIANQVENLYAKHSRNSMNETLYSLFVESTISRVLTPESLVVDQAMLLAVLHANIGSEVGAYVLQKLIEQFDKIYSPDIPIENKELDNLLLLVSHMYNFKIFESCLMYDILKKLSENFKEKDIDLILVILKRVGFMLRKDDPIALKNFIIKVQKMSHNMNLESNARMRFMLDILLSIKNNNITKVTDYDPAQNEHFKKMLKAFIRKGNSVTQLSIRLDDLLKADERGRWWIVGSAWNGKENNDSTISNSKVNASQGNYSSVILELARKQKMNTQNRKNIFCILMSAEDYLDAFEKLLKLGLKGQQEQEIPQIILHCLLQEKNYNPYYAHIGDQLCTSDRRHQMALQCALWDKFKLFTSLTLKQITILAKFLAQILLMGALPLSVLKVMEFSELDKKQIRFLRQTILSMFTNGEEDTVKQVFSRICKTKKLSLLRESLRLFLHHFMIRNLSDGAVKDKLEMVDSMLSEQLL